MDGDGGSYTLRRRNMLIVVMLVLFLGLVVVIATGVGLVLKDYLVNAAEATKEKKDVAFSGAPDDNEYNKLGVGSTLTIDSPRRSRRPSPA